MIYDNTRVKKFRLLSFFAIIAAVLALSFPALQGNAGATTLEELKEQLKQEMIKNQSGDKGDDNSGEKAGEKAGTQELTPAANGASEAAGAKSGQNYVLAIITDLHICSKTFNGKLKAIKTLNSWKDVNAVAVLGDLCDEIGTQYQYDQAEKFLKNLNHKKYCVTGNHDYIYDDRKTDEGKKIRASAKVKKQKLERFKKTFSPDGLHFAKKEAGYLLVFLSADALDEKYIVTISDGTLDWLDKTLDENKDLPTIIFCHAPLEGSLKKVGDLKDHAFAHTFKKLHKILKAHKQVFMWASGHTHTKPGSANFTAKENFWEKQIHVVHNPNMTTDAGGWINTLTLTPEYVLVKTFDCKNEKWLKKYERKITPKGVKVSDDEGQKDTDQPDADKNDDNDKDDPDTDKNADNGNDEGKADPNSTIKSNGFMDFIEKLFEKIRELIK